jgi:hypothetical protein
MITPLARRLGVVALRNPGQRLKDKRPPAAGVSSSVWDAVPSLARHSKDEASLRARLSSRLVRCRRERQAKNVVARDCGRQCRFFPRCDRHYACWNLTIHRSNQSELSVFTQTIVGRARSHDLILTWGAESAEISMATVLLVRSEAVLRGP